MAIAPLGIVPYRNNYIQDFGTLVILTIAYRAITSLPGVAAKNTDAKELCKKICAPLPGNSNDLPEKVCNEVCTSDGVVTKTRQWIGDKASPWIVPGLGALDCMTICGDVKTASINIGGSALFDFATGSKFKAVGQAAVKTGCAALGLFSSALCWACCAPLKFAHVI